MSNEVLPWIVLVTHGKLGEALMDSVEMIAGKLNNVKAISLMPGDTPEELVVRLKKELEDVKKILILVDLFGGTPSNVCAFFAKKGYPVMSGVNLPILLGAEMYRSSGDWDTIIDYLKTIGEESMINITERVNKREENYSEGD